MHDVDSCSVYGPDNAPIFLFAGERGGRQFAWTNHATSLTVAFWGQKMETGLISVIVSVYLPKL